MTFICHSTETTQKEVKTEPALSLWHLATRTAHLTDCLDFTLSLTASVLQSSSANQYGCVLESHPQ